MCCYKTQNQGTATAAGVLDTSRTEKFSYESNSTAFDGSSSGKMLVESCQKNKKVGTNPTEVVMSASYFIKLQNEKFSKYQLIATWKSNWA